MSAREHLVRLPDGRHAEVVEHGVPGGPAVLYLHGAMGSPLRRCAELDAALQALGLRCLMVQRPGFGRSDPQPGRALLDHAADLRAIADALRLDELHVLGVSAGGPYAAACAAALGDRLTGVGIVAGLSRLDARGGTAGMPRATRAALRLVRHAPTATRRTLDGGLGLLRAHPRLLVALMQTHRSRADASALADAEARASAVDSFRAATARGAGPMLDDLRVVLSPWGFDPGSIAVPVFVWHGIDDTLVPLEHALQLAIAIPGAQVSFAPEGHFFLRRRFAPILGALTGRDPGAREQLAPAASLAHA